MGRTRWGIRSALLSLLMLTGCGLVSCGGAVADAEGVGGRVMTTMASGGTRAAGGSSNEWGAGGASSEAGEGGSVGGVWLGASGGSDAGSDGAGAQACGVEPELEVGAGMVQVSIKNDPLPAPTGGPLVDGTYDLASWVVYGDPSLDFTGLDLREAIRVRDGGRVLDDRTADDEISSMAIGPRAAGAVALELSMICPLAASLGPVDYSASPGQLVIHSPLADRVGVLATFVLRP